MVLLRFTGEVSSQVLNHESTLGAWLDQNTGVTLLIVAAPFLIGGKLVDEYIRDMLPFYKREGCQVEAVTYCPGGAEVMHMQ